MSSPYSCPNQANSPSGCLIHTGALYEISPELKFLLLN